MPRRRKSVEPADSLDLLLDTICNTFGGVLFMAMLICLLSGGPAKQKPVDEQALAQQQLHVLSAIEQRERDEAAAADQLNQAEQANAAAMAEAQRLAAVSGADVERIVELANQFANSGQLVHEALASVEVIDELTKEISTLKSSLAQAKSERTRQQQALLDAQQAAQKAAESNRVLVRFPKAQETFKSEVVAYVSGGRLYAGIYPDSSYSFRPFYRGNTNSALGGISSDELPSALGSVIIDTPEKARAAIAAQGLDGLSPTMHYVMFAVWPDSHEAFRLLRNELSSRRVGYGLLLLETYSSVTFGKGPSYEQ